MSLSLRDLSVPHLSLSLYFYGKDGIIGKMKQIPEISETLKAATGYQSFGH
jgi:hypothetical protein